MTELEGHPDWKVIENTCEQTGRDSLHGVPLQVWKRKTGAVLAHGVRMLYGTGDQCQTWALLCGGRSTQLFSKGSARPGYKSVHGPKCVTKRSDPTVVTTARQLPWSCKAHHVPALQCHTHALNLGLGILPSILPSILPRFRYPAQDLCLNLGLPRSPR